MRMRLKKHLDERMDKVSSLVLFIENECFLKKSFEEKKNIFDFSLIFGNDNPVCIEIGCGKGKFVNEIACRYPDINFIAVERLTNVIVTAVEKTESLGLKNVRYLNVSAENLPCFIPEKSIKRIYLNFSCPYPKNTYANRRLTNKRFLGVYESLLMSGGDIYQKTDNKNFFAYSLEQYSLAGYKLKNVTLDLTQSEEENVVTEYEQKFIEKNMPIYKLEAYK